MKVTIFGATGLLGKALMREWREDRVTGLSSKDADVRDPRQVKDAVEGTHPDWIVLAAAYTDVDGCETNRERKITPYEVGDPRAPQSVYGRSKAEAEMRLENILPNCCIVRTSWLFGVGGKCFPDTILKLASTRAQIDVVNDQLGSPTYAIDLARAIIQLCRKGAKGVVHVTNRGECTWFDFAQAIVSAAGLKTIIRPTTTEKFPRPAQRPKYSVLSASGLDHYGVGMPDWQDALRRYLIERSSAGNPDF